MLYQIIITTLIGLFLLNLILNLYSLKTPGVRNRLKGPLPLVSVIVPARNEAKNIGPCLDSLLKQDYPDFEIIVVDDNSSDDTPVIVSRLAAADRHLKLIHGDPLPDDWAGKPFACIQGARQACGEWLVFADADTRHEPGMLSRIIPLAIESGASMISGFPRQITTSLAQKITLPMIYFILMAWAPFWWLHRSRRLPPSIAYGAFILFPSAAYWRFGGHEAVKNRVLEDVWLGVETSRHGGRHLAGDLSPVVSCHMYDSLHSIWEGFTKWMYSVSAESTVGLATLVVLGYTTLLAPFYWCWRAIFVLDYTPAWAILPVMQVLVILLMRQLVDNRFRSARFSSLLFPFSMAFLLAVVLYGMARQVAGVGVSWKNRIYGKASGAD